MRSRGGGLAWSVVAPPVRGAFWDDNVQTKFQIYVNASNQYAWRLLAINSRIIATAGESYIRKLDCEHGVNLVKGTTSLTQYEVYGGTDGLWRWRLKATNGQIIAISSESYQNKADAEWGAGIAVATNTNTPVEDLTLAGARR